MKIIDKIFRTDQYLKQFDPEYLKIFFEEMYKFYDDSSYAFVNVGFQEETQIKFKYNPEQHSIDVAFECSRNNRVQKKSLINWDWFCNLFWFPTIFSFKRMKTYNDESAKIWSHTGFTLCWNKCIDFYTRTIEAMLNEHPDVTQIRQYGWSLGGAMTIFAHSYAQERYEEERGILVTSMTIGAPKPFFMSFLFFWRIPSWIRFVKKFKRLIMFQNRNDVVPTMPLKLMGFRHIVPTYKLNKFNIVKFFKPNIYHLNTNYYKEITEDLTKRIIEDSTKYAKLEEV